MTENTAVDTATGELETVHSAELVDERSVILTDLENFGSADSGFKTTMKAGTQLEKMKVLAAASNSKPLNEHLGETLNLLHVVARPVTIFDPETKEENYSIRMVLVCEEGTFHATSRGVFTAVNDLIGFLGEPSEWQHPAPIQAVEERTRRGFRVTTLRYDLEKLIALEEANAKAKGAK